MEPVILFGLFTLFTIYGLWLPIPMTTVNPYSPLPARIAGSIQLTATTNSAMSVFRSVMWPTTNSTAYLNDSLNTTTLILNDRFEDFLNKWDHKFEKHIKENVEPSIPMTTTCTPTPTLEATAINTLWPEFYTAHPEYNEWVGYTLYCFVKQEIRRNPNMYTVAALFILFNYWLVCSARRSELCQQYNIAKGLPADGITEIHEELAAHNARLELLEAKVDGLLSVPATGLAGGQNKISKNASERVPPLNNTMNDMKRNQPLSTNQPGRLELESLQEQLMAMRQDLVSLKNYSETRSERSAERIDSIMETIKELKKSAETERFTNRLEDIGSIKKRISEEMKSELQFIQGQIADLERATASLREETRESITKHISPILDTINKMKKESEKSKRKSQLADFATIKEELPRGHESNYESLQDQIMDLRQTASAFKEESKGYLAEQVSSIMGKINELRKDCEIVKRMNHGAAIDSVKKDVSNLEISMRNIKRALDEKRDDTRAVDMTNLKASLEALQQGRTRDLKDLSTRLDKVGEEIQSKPWTAESKRLNQWISKVESKLQTLESCAVTEKSPNHLQSQLELLSTKVDFVESSLKELKEETATKFEHKTLSMTVRHLECCIQQWETIPQRYPSGAISEEDSIKLRDLGKNYVDLKSEVGEIKDAFTTLVSSDIPRQRSEDYNQITKTIRQNSSQLEKKIESLYACKEDIRKCLKVIQPEGDKPIDLQRLKKKLSELENYAYSTKNDLNMATERITDSEQHIETLREGNATNYKDIRQCLGKLGLTGTIVPLSDPINPKSVPAESKAPVHIDMSVGRKVNSSQDRGDKNISRFDPRYKGDDKPSSPGSSSVTTKDLIGIKKKEGRNQFDKSDKGNTSNAGSLPLKGAEDLETRLDKNISRYDPRYKGDDKFRSSFPASSKTKEKLNPKAESFEETPQRGGNGSLASRASFSSLVLAGKENLEAEEPAAEEGANIGEDPSQSLDQASSSQEKHQGVPPDSEEKKADSSSALGHSSGNTPILPPADTVAEKFPEKPAEIEMGDTE